MFVANLKVHLGLILPNQCCHVIVRKIEAGFIGDILSLANSLSLLYSTIVLYDKIGGHTKQI